MAYFSVDKCVSGHLVENYISRKRWLGRVVALLVGISVLNWNTHATYISEQKLSSKAIVQREDVPIELENLRGILPTSSSIGVTEANIQDCTKQTACSCLSSTLGMVDLSPLAGSLKPRFENVLAESGDAAFYWNPCIAFTLKDTPCTDVAVCQDMKFAHSTFLNLGTQDTADFTLDNGDLILSYFANTFKRNSSHQRLAQNEPEPENFMRMSHFKLVCDITQDPGTLIAHGVNPDKFRDYLFTFSSVHACPAKLKPKRKFLRSYPSVGTCLLITCIFGLVLYISVGILVQVLLRRQSGLDALPHRSFWLALPGLVKDGVLFCVNGGKASGYSNI